MKKRYTFAPHDDMSTIFLAMGKRFGGRSALYLLLTLLLTACGGGGAVVFAPTPRPPDDTPATYAHPSGVFTLVAPQRWATQTRNTTVLATTALSAPGDHSPLVTVAVVRLPAPPEGANAIRTLLDAYQGNVRPDVSRYTEQAREAMPDGSWRMTGLRAQPTGPSTAINTFIEIDGPYVAVVEARLPQDADLRIRVETVVNSVALTGNGLEPTDLETLSFASSGRLEALNVNTWTTPDGVFFVTGEVVNYSDTTLTDIPVTARLRTEDGREVAEAVDTVMSHGIPPGGFAPFSLRFGQGQPPLTSGYTLGFGGPDWTLDPEAAVITDDVLSWTDESTLTEDGRLIVTGTVTNTSESVFVYVPRAVVTTFDGAQRVAAAGFTDIADVELEPGESASFEVVLPEFSTPPTRYIVQVQGRP